LVTKAFTLMTTVDSANLGQSNVPYLTASFITSGNATVSPILGYRVGGPAATPNAGRVFQSTLIVNGQGAAQTSTLSVMTAGVFYDNGTFGPTFAGGFNATSQSTSAYFNITRAAGGVSSTPSSVVVDSDLLPTGSFSSNQNEFSSDGPNSQYFTSTASDNANPNGHSYVFNQPVTRVATTPSGLGTDHPDRSMVGYVGGVMYTQKQDLNGNRVGPNGPAYIVTNASGSPGDVSVTLLGAASRVGAIFNIVAAGPNGTSPSQSSDSVFFANRTQTAQLRFGDAPTTSSSDAGGTNTARGTYVDTRNFAARSEAIFNPTNGSNADTSTLNGQPFTAGTGPRSLMVVSDAVGANTVGFLSSISSTAVTPCDCEFTRWGFWSMSGIRTDTADGVQFADRTNLAVWVAGVPANAVDIPTTGTAVYSGHTIANIYNSGNSYIAAGTFSNSVNFGTGTGAVAINGLDGTNYAGTVNLAAGTTQFSGGLTGSVAGRAAALSGSFFQGGPTNTTPLYGEMGGNIIISGGANYFGSGIFAGRKP
jgi:hypothetical protein